MTHQYDDGIYFNMPEADYHDQNRLSSSGIQNLLVSPATFWKSSWLNPDFEREEKPHYDIGKAYHCARLEPDKFNDRFARKPHKDEFEGPTTGTELKAELKALGEPQSVSGEKVADQARRLKDAGYPNDLYHLAIEFFEEHLGDRTAIDGTVWDEIERDVALLAEIEEVAKHLKGGCPEVSVLWTLENKEDAWPQTQMKARLDYLRPDSFTDFKTFENGQRKVLDQCLADAFRYNRYYIQAYVYHLACEAVRLSGLPIYQFNDDETPEIPETLESHALIDMVGLQPLPLEAWYVWQEKKGVPNLLARRFEIFRGDRDIARMSYEQGITEQEAKDRAAKMMQRESLIGLKAKLEVGHALRLFENCPEIFGDKPWGSLEPVGTIGDNDFPGFWLEQ